MGTETDIHGTNNNHNKISMDAFLYSIIVCFIFTTVLNLGSILIVIYQKMKLRNKDLSCPRSYNCRIKMCDCNAIHVEFLKCTHSQYLYI